MVTTSFCATQSGEAAALQSRIRINLLTQDQLPDSHDISFINGWINEADDVSKLTDIVNRLKSNSMYIDSKR